MDTMNGKGLFFHELPAERRLPAVFRAVEDI